MRALRRVWANPGGRFSRAEGEEVPPTEWFGGPVAARYKTGIHGEIRSLPNSVQKVAGPDLAAPTSMGPRSLGPFRSSSSARLERPPTPQRANMAQERALPCSTS